MKFEQVVVHNALSSDILSCCSTYVCAQKLLYYTRRRTLR